MSNNTFSGGVNDNNSYKNNILEFDIRNQKWTQVGNMNYAAHSLGVSEVDFADFELWCNAL